MSIQNTKEAFEAEFGSKEVGYKMTNWTPESVLRFIEERERLVGEVARVEERQEFNDCSCQEKWTLGVVHRKDGPCYWPRRDSAATPTNNGSHE